MEGDFSIYLTKWEETKGRSVKIGETDTLSEAERFAKEFAAVCEEHLSGMDKNRIEIRWKSTTETVSLKDIDVGPAKR